MEVSISYARFCSKTCEIAINILISCSIAIQQMSWVFLFTFFKMLLTFPKCLHFFQLRSSNGRHSNILKN